MKIGNRVLLGPSVQIYTATHPLDPKARNGTKGREFAKPIIIEDDVWIGGAAILCPGVLIGEGAVTGAGDKECRTTDCSWRKPCQVYQKSGINTKFLGTNITHKPTYCQRLSELP